MYVSPPDQHSWGFCENFETPVGPTPQRFSKVTAAFWFPSHAANKCLMPCFLHICAFVGGSSV